MNNATNPSYYNSTKISPIDYIEDQNLGFCLGNAIKYISRAGKKNPSTEIEDLEKAMWYIERRIKELQAEKPSIRVCGNCKWYIHSTYSCAIRPTATTNFKPDEDTCKIWEPNNNKEK